VLDLKRFSSSLIHRPPLTLTAKILIVMALISLRWLFAGNMGSVNELDVLPLARQHVDPNWIPGDWYLNQPTSYRLLFESLAGNLIVLWGFLATSLVGRLVCYGLVSTALVQIGEKLRLKFLPLILAIELFMVGNTQGVIASEWIVGRLEAKSLAYSFVLLALWMLLEKRYGWMALLLGIATSFHVLVGGWAFLIAAGTLALDANSRSKLLRPSIWLLGIYLSASLFAVQPVLTQLLTSTPAFRISPSAIYVFLRLPHHLNPLIWSTHFIRLGWMLLAFWWVGRILRQQARLTDHLADHLTNHLADRDRQAAFAAQMQLARFTWVSLIPFVVGLLATPFDQEGSLLQYYPFRVGDVMLPLTTYLLAACAMQQGISAKQQQRAISISLSLLLVTVLVQVGFLGSQLWMLRQFPTADVAFKELCAWVKQETPPGSPVITSPVDFVEFTWLAERPTVAKYKLLPQTKTGIIEWYERLGDLNGGSFPAIKQLRTADHRDPLRRTLRQNYYQLNPTQVKALMDKYQANYFMTLTEHQLPFPVAYRNASYLVYGRPDSPSKQ